MLLENLREYMGDVTRPMENALFTKDSTVAAKQWSKSTGSCCATPTTWRNTIAFNKIFLSPASVGRTCEIL